MMDSLYMLLFSHSFYNVLFTVILTFREVINVKKKFIMFIFSLFI